MIKVVDNYPDEGKWIVARAEYIPSSAENHDLYVGTVNGFAEMGEAGGGVLPDPGDYREFGEALYISGASGITNWAVLAHALTNRTARNFYFDGHGGPAFIGPAVNAAGEGKRLGAKEVAILLGNANLTTNANRYRWVWIDSCSSAVGDAWPRTFGMGTRQNVALGDYTSRPAAFCGFIQDVYGWTPFHNRVDIKSINFRSYFVLFWFVENMQIKDAFESAQFFSEWSPWPSYLRIYGFWGLYWNEFNTKLEWPP